MIYNTKVTMDSITGQITWNILYNSWENKAQVYGKSCTMKWFYEDPLSVYQPGTVIIVGISEEVPCPLRGYSPEGQTDNSIFKKGRAAMMGELSMPRKPTVEPMC